MIVINKAVSRFEKFACVPAHIVLANATITKGRARTYCMISSGWILLQKELQPIVV